MHITPCMVHFHYGIALPSRECRTSIKRSYKLCFLLSLGLSLLTGFSFKNVFRTSLVILEDFCLVFVTSYLARPWEE